VTYIGKLVHDNGHPLTTVVRGPDDAPGEVTVIVYGRPAA
jgi:hypothetical protein